MRFNRPRKPDPVIGDQRERDGFLWLPKRINGEIRWLEWACWIEEFVEGIDFSPGVTGNMPPSECVYWRAKEWHSCAPPIGI